MERKQHWTPYIINKDKSRANKHTKKKKKLQIHTPVFARNYRHGNPNCLSGIIQARKRKRMYEVKVGNQVWVRHKSRPRQTKNELVPDSPYIPFDLLKELSTLNGEFGLVRTTTMADT